MEMILVVVGIVALWLFVAYFWPYIPCGKCTRGARAAPVGTAWRNCPTCKGRGRKHRPLAMLFGKHRQEAKRWKAS